MGDRYIYELANRFRNYIECARDDGVFSNDIFDMFPNNCCGDASCLLAQFLLEENIQTLYVWGDFEGQTHAWLVLKDERIETPIKQNLDLPTDIESLLNTYSGGKYNSLDKNLYYSEQNIINGLLIDITADQFGETPVFVNYLDDFHRKFEFRSASVFQGLYDGRLSNLYNKIVSYE